MGGEAVHFHADLSQCVDGQKDIALVPLEWRQILEELKNPFLHSKFRTPYLKIADYAHTCRWLLKNDFVASAVQK